MLCLLRALRASVANPQCRARSSSWPPTTKSRISPLSLKKSSACCRRHDLLVIDDNSPDGTGQWCDEQAHREPRLKCVHRAGKLGLGTATLLGLQQAIDQGYEVAVTMDADWSHDPKFLNAPA